MWDRQIRIKRRNTHISDEMIGIVGPTGSGKSTLISDIEQLSQGDTPTQRKILINGEVPDRNIRTDPKKKRIAQLSQNIQFLADMTVGEFLRMHAKSRNRNVDIIEKVHRNNAHSFRKKLFEFFLLK